MTLARVHFSRGARHRIRAVGFDLGETLIFYADTALSWSSLYSPALSCVATACEARPTADDLQHAEEILARYNTRLIARSQEVTASEILGEILAAWRIDPQDRVDLAIEAFFGFFQRRIAPAEENRVVLSNLRKRGLPIGVLTDVPYGMPRRYVENDLSRAGLLDFVEALLTSGDVGVRKPEPAGYVDLASLLEVAAEELLYVGNEQKDIVGARAAGCRTALLSLDGARPEWGQQATISSLDQLLTIVGPCGQCQMPIS